MKVGVLQHDLASVAGATRFTFVLGNVLKEVGYEIAYACVRENVKELEKKFGYKFDFLVYKLKKIWVKEVYGPLFVGDIGALVNFVPVVRKLCKEFKPDVIIGVEPLTCFIPPIFMNIPTIYHCTSPVTGYFVTQHLESEHYRGIHRVTSFPYRKLEEMITKKITTICYTSEWVKKKLPYPFNKGSVVLSNPVDTDLFKPREKKENIILCVLRFMPEARYGNMIDAFKKLKRDDFSLYIVGGLDSRYIDYYKFLEGKIKNCENIKLLPNADFDTLLQLYQSAKIFWYPISAQFGIVLIEAQACGLPIIARDPYKTGPSEIVDNGVNGFIVDDFDRLVEKTVLLLDDEKKLGQMSKNARKNAVENYSIEAFKKKVVNLIENCVKK
ncbi:MAG: glycosyltransferase [Candidatus Thermoplasmatota archaeon]|nr:glycosyltransferase [Candidatus Thermoplasmatota archaeon]